MSNLPTAFFLFIFVCCALFASDKDLVSPYFDRQHYCACYGNQLLVGKIDPLDHFLSIDFQGDWFHFTDPNAWFNTALYLRTFPCLQNPFVDFLSQSPLVVAADAPVMDVYCREEEATRAWLAVEALLRLNKYQVILHLSPDFSEAQFQMFASQLNRGLVVLYDNFDQFSFYRSSFLQNPIDGASYESYEWNRAVSLWDNDPRLLVHRAYHYNFWASGHYINPLRFNFFHFIDEPNFSVGINPLEAYVRKISQGFDLIFCPVRCASNVRIIPGYMETWINTDELDLEKEYSISYLLSTGFQGCSPSWNYVPRIYVWNHEEQIEVPTRFYLTRRGIEQFPKEMRQRCLPTDTKKWIFNSQFTIAIENNRQANYMTEKLLGCFVSLSVPIYIGCLNVRDYFDERGMFIAESAQEVIRICQSITPETYEQMLPYLIENKRRALELMQLQRKFIQEFLDNLPLEPVRLFEAFPVDLDDSPHRFNKGDQPLVIGRRDQE